MTQQITHQECPEAPGKPGEDNRTHHMVGQRDGTSRCAYCHKSVAELAA